MGNECRRLATIPAARSQLQMLLYPLATQLQLRNEFGNPRAVLAEQLVAIRSAIDTGHIWGIDADGYILDEHAAQ